MPGSPGLGYEGWRALIGDQSGHGFYAPIKGAIATYFRRHGSDADPTWLRANLEDVIVERGHTRDPQYIESRIRGLDGLINHIRVLQAADEIRRLEAPFTVTRGQREFTVRAPSYTAPTSTIEEVCQSLTSALSPVILQYVPEAASQRRQWLAAAAIAEAEGAQFLLPLSLSRLAYVQTWLRGKPRLHMKVCSQHSRTTATYACCTLSPTTKLPPVPYSASTISPGKR